MNVKDKYVYPAIFDFDNDGITVTFPDLPGCITCGDSQEEAFRNAKEVLKLYIYGLEQDGEKIPEPSQINLIKTDDSQCIVLVDISIVHAKGNLKIYEKENINNKSYSYIIPLKDNHGVEIDYGIYDINLELSDKDFGKEKYIDLKEGDSFILEINQKLNLALQLIYLDGKLMISVYEGTHLVDWKICNICL